MASTMKFEGVTEAMLVCMKRNGVAAGTTYDPPEGNTGTATTKVPVFGSVVLAYQLDTETSVILYEITKRPAAVPESAVWARVAQAVSDCKSDGC